MVKHKHRRHIRYPARLSASLGYAFISLSWLLVLGMIGIVVIEWVASLFPAVPAYDDNGLWYGVLSAGMQAQYGTQGEAGFGVKILMLGAFIVAVAYASHFITVHASQFLRYFITTIGLKLTATHLFVTKCLFGLLAPLTMMVVVLGLPYFSESLDKAIVGVTAAMSSIGVACFAIQQVIVRQAKMAIKDII